MREGFWELDDMTRGPWSRAAKKKSVVAAPREYARSLVASHVKRIMYPPSDLCNRRPLAPAVDGYKRLHNLSR